jgi:type II secretion system protein H
MPILATGRRAPRDAGFTLIETIVALAVIALLAGLAVMAAPGLDARARSEAERFAAFVARGGQESIMTNRALALTVSPEGFGFSAMGPQGWAPLPPGDRLAFRRWPAGVDATLVAEAQTRIVFDVLGGADPAQVRIGRAGAAYAVDITGAGEIRVSRAP